MKSSAKVKRMSIGEFSTLSGISVKALRHWDESGFLHHRGLIEAKYITKF